MQALDLIQLRLRSLEICLHAAKEENKELDGTGLV